MDAYTTTTHIPLASERRSGTRSKPVRIEDLDLAAVASRLKQRFRGIEPRGYLRGKTRMRNAVMTMFRVSAVDAESLVDLLHARGFVRYMGDPTELDHGRQPWMFNAGPLRLD